MSLFLDVARNVEQDLVWQGEQRHCAEHVHNFFWQLVFPIGCGRHMKFMTIANSRLEIRVGGDSNGFKEAEEHFREPEPANAFTSSDSCAAKLPPQKSDSNVDSTESLQMNNMPGEKHHPKVQK